MNYGKFLEMLNELNRIKSDASVEGLKDIRTFCGYRIIYTLLLLLACLGGVLGSYKVLDGVFTLVCFALCVVGSFVAIIMLIHFSHYYLEASKMLKCTKLTSSRP